MKFTYEQLITEILNSELSTEEKTELIARIHHTSKIMDGFYLKKDNEGHLECWYRNVDENGVTDHGPTNFDAQQVVSEYISTVKARRR